jgi:Tfp pilus assembly protein PilX
MRYLRNERGVSLVIVLVISAISLAIMSSLLYMLMAGTRISGMQKRFATALEAGRAGVDVTEDFINSRAKNELTNIAFVNALSATCGDDKIKFDTTSWDPACDSTLIVNSAVHDFRFDMGTPPYQYRTYAKIANTVEGNSGSSTAVTGLVRTGVVGSNAGEVQVVSIPYLYTIEMLTENTTQDAERARLSLLYQY